MSKKGAGAQKEESGNGSGLLSSLLLAGGAAAVGFIAHDVWSKWKEFQAQAENGQSSSRAPPRRSWDDIEGNNTKTTKKVRQPADVNMPEGLKCIVCLENPRELIIMPCGHVCLCEDCGEQVRDNCPCCREKIQSKKKAYLP